MTVALKTESYFTFEAAGYHDNLSLTAVPAVPALGNVGLALLTILIVGVGVFTLRS